METSYTATVTSKGQLTLPSAIRKLHGIKAGHTVKFVKHDKKSGLISFKVENSLDLVDQLAGSLYRPGMKYVPIEKVREIAGYALGKKYQVKNDN